MCRLVCPNHHVVNNGGQVNPLGIKNDINQIRSVVGEISPVGGMKDVVGEDAIRNLDDQSTVLV